MKLYITESTNPFYNLACEEYMLRFSEDDVFMLWQNEPSVIIGKNQNLYAEVDLTYTEPRGIHVSRRITGGGAVYHDLGNVNYSFITSREKANVLDFRYFTAPVLKALKSLGVNAALSGRNDLISEVSEGEWAKFSGSAQTATKTRILHHGTLLFDSDLTVLSKTLKPDEEKLRSKAIKSVRSRVMNLKPTVDKGIRALSGTVPFLTKTQIENGMTTGDFLQYLLSFAEKEFDCERMPVDRLSVLETGLYDRNLSDDYNAGRKREYENLVKKHFPSGIVVVLWNTEDGHISECAIEGDYFGELDTADLSAKLTGCEPTGEGLAKALEGADVSNYISGVTNEAFIALISSGK